MPPQQYRSIISCRALRRLRGGRRRRNCPVLTVQRDTGKTWQTLNVRAVPHVGVLQRLIAR